jgi:hypothetical protein
LQAESDSGEFWVLFGGFAPIGKKAVSDDDIVLETTQPKLYRYVSLMNTPFPACQGWQQEITRLSVGRMVGTVLI